MNRLFTWAPIAYENRRRPARSLALSSSWMRGLAATFAGDVTGVQSSAAPSGSGLKDLVMMPLLSRAGQVHALTFPSSEAE
jgi:hypothetical protein